MTGFYEILASVLLFSLLLGAAWKALLDAHRLGRVAPTAEAEETAVFEDLVDWR